MSRTPAVAGQFYESSEDRLEEQIKNCFKISNGPKKVPGKPKGKKPIIAAVVPHAGYQYSGACAAHAYKKIAEAAKPDVFVIIGPNHSGMGPSVAVYPKGAWLTPLGEAKIDEDFVTELLKNSKFAQPDEFAHRYEHSVEVQIPFLQFIYKNDFKIVPIAMKSLQVIQESEDLINAIVIAAKKLNKTVTIIASSDFTHYGSSYMYTPFKGTKAFIKEKLYKMDKKSIKLIEKLDGLAFLKNLVQTNATICGYGPITAAIIYARFMKAKKGKLLKFYTSGDITKDYTSSVSYASIIFE